MTESLHPMLRRALALAILLALVLLVWSLAVQPAVDRYWHYREAAEQSQMLLARYRSLGASSAEHQSELRNLQRSAATRTRVLKGASPAIAAAQLQNRVKGIVLANGGKLKSTQILAGKEESGFRQVTIRVAMDTNTDSLQSILYQLETSGVYYFLDNFQIRARAGGRPPNERTKFSDLLDVRFDVSGYMGGDRS